MGGLQQLKKKIHGKFSTTLQACRHFNDSGVCKENCPPPAIYNPVTFQSEPNPDRKFSFGATCVKTCPCENHFLNYNIQGNMPPSRPFHLANILGAAILDPTATDQTWQHRSSYFYDPSGK